MENSRIWTHAWAFLAVTLLASCTSHDFSGVGGSKKPKSDEVKTTAPTTISDGPGGPQDNQEVVKAGSKAENAAEIKIQSAAAQCLIKKADFYNFVVIFDASSSTNNTDPTNVRRVGAIQFAEKIGKLAAMGPKPEFQVSAMAFNKVAYAGASGWLKLGTAAAVTGLGQDIITLTSDPKVGTHFNDAFILGDSLLAKRGALGSDKRQRNFFILMSDGKANGKVDDDEDLQIALTEIIKTKGVAVISIGAGEDLNDRGRTTMKGLALPVAGIVGTDHIGRYYDAPTDQAVQKAWEDLYKIITTCDDMPKSP